MIVIYIDYGIGFAASELNGNDRLQFCFRPDLNFPIYNASSVVLIETEISSSSLELNSAQHHLISQYHGLELDALWSLPAKGSALTPHAIAIIR